jgi:hypothetical protein
MTEHSQVTEPSTAALPVAEFDAQKRRAAVGLLDMLRETLRRKHGTMSTQEIVALLGTRTGPS